MSAEMLWPVYEFRPLPSDFQVKPRRYAEGKWIDDDGEYDVAFIGSEMGAPICLYFEPPYQRNIVLSWVTGHWAARESRHPRGNAWHYMLREGTKDWGGDWGRDMHPNVVAGRKGMNELCRTHRGANGRHIELHLDDPHIAAGLLRERQTKRVYTFPEPVCMYCGPAHAEKAA